jgi:uncharacterized protein
MKKLTFSPKSISLLLALLLGIAVQNAFSQDTKPFSLDESPLPQPTEPVNDYAGVIDEATKQQLNQKIKDFKARTNPSVVLAVAVVKTTGDRDIFDYSLAVYRGWKIGTAADDNPGALLFVAVDDRKYFTQVSKDLEDELPDGLAGQIQRQYLVPAFKQNDYGKGISDTIDAYIRTIDAKQNGTATPTPAQQVGQTKESRGSFSICGGFPCLIILFVLMLVIFGRGGRGRNNNNRWGGGGGFGGGGGSVLPWIIGSAIANSIGNSSSGGSSSSDWGGGSSGGGDWGGFGGGGDAGGGGAGGSW